MGDRTTIPMSNHSGQPEAGTDAHAEAMAQKARDAGVSIKTTDRDGNQTVIQAGQAPASATPPSTDNGQADPKVPQRPAEVPEKFWNAEKGEVNYAAWSQSYKELENKQTQAGDQKAKDQPAPEGEQEAQPPSAQSAIDAAAAEFGQNGKLSEETYGKLAEAGLNRDAVDTYIAGRQAKTVETENRIFEAAGTNREGYDDVLGWAKTALTPEEITAFNESLAGSEAAAVLAIKNLTERHQKEANHDPKVVLEGGAAAGDGLYRSRQEMMDDMGSPKYAKDPAFREMVAKKVLGSKRAGINLRM